MTWKNPWKKVISISSFLFCLLSYGLFCQILFNFALWHSHLISHFTPSLILFTQVSKNKRLYPTLSLCLCPRPIQQKRKRAQHRHPRKTVIQEIRVIRKENSAMEDRTKNDEKGIKKTMMIDNHTILILTLFYSNIIYYIWYFIILIMFDVVYL